MAEDYTGPPATLGNWQDLAIDVTAHCRKCGHAPVIPAGDLAAKLGRDFPVPAVGKRLRCTVCGHRGADVRARVRNAPFSTGHVPPE